MQRLVRLCAPAILILGLGLTGCDSNDNAAKEPAPVEEPAADQDLIEPAGGGETTMPGYAKPASSQFALPVPEDWAEHEPFKEEKLGAKASMAGSFIYPGAAAEAAQTYRDLLTEAGFVIHNHPLGEATNQASFIAEGNIGGTQYSGTFDFDAIADGTQRVAINLTED